MGPYLHPGVPPGPPLGLQVVGGMHSDSRQKPPEHCCTAWPSTHLAAGAPAPQGSPMSRLPTSHVVPGPVPLQTPAPRQAVIGFHVPPLQVSSVAWSGEQPRVSAPAWQGAPARGGP